MIEEEDRLWSFTGLNNDYKYWEWYVPDNDKELEEMKAKALVNAL